MQQWFDSEYTEPQECVIPRVSTRQTALTKRRFERYAARPAEQTDVYTDGSLVNGKAAYAVWIKDQPLAHEQGRVIGPQTAPRAEASGFVAGVFVARQVRAPTFILDCLPVIKAIRRYAKYGPEHLKYIANADLIAYGVMCANEFFGDRWSVRWTQGHAGVEGNEAADKLAKAAIAFPAFRSRFAFASMHPWLPDNKLFINGMPMIGAANGEIERMCTDQRADQYQEDHHPVHFLMRNDARSNKWLKDNRLPPKLVRVIRLIKDGNLRTRAKTASFRAAENDAHCVLCGHENDDLAHSLAQCPHLYGEFINRTHDAVWKILDKSCDLSRGSVRSWFDAVIYDDTGYRHIEAQQALDPTRQIAARIGLISDDAVKSISYLKKRRGKRIEPTARIVRRLQKCTASLLQSQWIAHSTLSHEMIENMTI